MKKYWTDFFNILIGIAFPGGVMARRGGDTICALAGAVLLFLGSFAYFFPEISYRSKEETISVKRVYVWKKIIIPHPASIAAVLTGGLLLYQASKIRRRRRNR